MTRKSDMFLIASVLDMVSKDRRKAVLNQKDKYGQTPLFKAISGRYLTFGGHKNVGATNKFRYLADLFLLCNADVNVADNLGYTILDRLAEKEERDSLMVQCLLKNNGTYNKFFDPDELSDLKKKLKGENKRYNHVVVKKKKHKNLPHFK
jgi:ankyrin repeat protein